MMDAKTSLQAWLSGAAAQRVLAVSLAASSTFVLLYIVYQRFFAPLAKVRGPFWASLSPAWKLVQLTRGNFHETIVDLHEEYGPIVRIAPNEVIISDKSAIREIYSTTQGRDFLKVSMDHTPVHSRMLTVSRRTTMSGSHSLWHLPDHANTEFPPQVRSQLSGPPSSASEIPICTPSGSGSCRMAIP
jgi:hypothetical protein